MLELLFHVGEASREAIWDIVKGTQQQEESHQIPVGVARSRDLFS